MPSTKKPRKAYKPRERRLDNAALIFEGDQPLPDDTRNTILMPFHEAIRRIAHEDAPPSCWKKVVDGFNTAAAMCEQAGNSAIGLEIIYAGQNAMIAVRERMHQHNTLRFGANELPAINEAAALYETLLKTVSKRQYTKAVKECARRQAQNLVVKVKPFGTPRLGELREAA